MQKKTNHKQKKKMLIICKQLNGAVLKSLNASYREIRKIKIIKRNQKNNWPVRARTEIFFLYFGLGRDCSHAGRAGPGRKNPARADL